MKARHIIIALAAALCAMFRAGAVSPYEVLSGRADRFFDQKEWAQASAVYDLMLDERPAVTATYGRAIVANAMRNDSVAQMALMQKALDNHIPFDSVFSRVRQTSFSLGKTSLYERFLTHVRAAYPWMKRTVDGYLLRYYAYRRNGLMMVRYSDLMLAGAPANIEFLTLRGQGLFLQNLEQEAVDTFTGILEIDPDNFTALVTLGNWYADAGTPASRTVAREYLSHALSVHPTPYVAARLAALPVQ